MINKAANLMPHITKFTNITKFIHLSHLLILGYLVGLISVVQAQDPVYSQFYSNPLELNPALAGVSGGTRIGLNYRNQWPNLNANYTTYAISADHYFTNFNSGLGAALSYDNSAYGIIRTINAEIAYAYQLQTRNDAKIRLGFQAGIISASLDWDKLIFYDAIDPEFGPISPGGTPYPTDEIPPDYTHVTRIDASVGGLYIDNRFYAGLSLKHLARPDITFYKPTNTKKGLPIRTIFHAGYEFPIETNAYRRNEVSIVPNILVAKQGITGQINAGVLVNISTINAGLYYRHAFHNPDAVIVSIGMDYQNIRAGYSYDATISKLGFSTGGTHEVFLSVVFQQEPETKYDCRKIFR